MSNRLDGNGAILTELTESYLKRLSSFDVIYTGYERIVFHAVNTAIVAAGKSISSVL